MRSLEKRLTAIEKKLSPLYLIRKDLNPINEIMAILNIRNRYSHEEKEQIILSGVKEIKNIIIGLAEKYKSEV